MAELTAAGVGERLDEARSRIEAAGGDAAAVRIVAVTKGFGPVAGVAAFDAGCADIGENYAQSLVAKAPDALALGARMHFLGAIQRNKVARLAPYVHLWQSVDRLEVGESLSRRAPGAAVLVQVDLLEGAVAGRAGVSPAGVADLVGKLRDLELEVRGLMAVGPPPPADPAPAFRRIAALREELELEVLSLGMSGDLEAAVRAGSTMVRLGTALFGPRPKT